MLRDSNSNPAWASLRPYKTRFNVSDVTDLSTFLKILDVMNAFQTQKYCSHLNYRTDLRAVTWKKIMDIFIFSIKYNCLSQNILPTHHKKNLASRLYFTRLRTLTCSWLLVHILINCSIFIWCITSLSELFPFYLILLHYFHPSSLFEVRKLFHWSPTSFNHNIKRKETFFMYIRNRITIL